jgi:hypothetical protein
LWCFSLSILRSEARPELKKLILVLVFAAYLGCTCGCGGGGIDSRNKNLDRPKAANEK